MSPKLWCVWGGRSDGGVRALGDGHGLRAQSPDSEAEREPHGRYPASMAEGTPPQRNGEPSWAWQQTSGRSEKSGWHVSALSGLMGIPDLRANWRGCFCCNDGDLWNWWEIQETGWQFPPPYICWCFFLLFSVSSALARTVGVFASGYVSLTLLLSSQWLFTCYKPAKQITVLVRLCVNHAPCCTTLLFVYINRGVGGGL